MFSTWYWFGRLDGFCNRVFKPGTNRPEYIETYRKGYEKGRERAERLSL